MTPHFLKPLPEILLSWFVHTPEMRNDPGRNTEMPFWRDEIGSFFKLGVKKKKNPTISPEWILAGKTIHDAYYSINR